MPDEMMDHDLALLDISSDRSVPLFMPHVTDAMRAAVEAQMQTRWIGQGPGVDAFEAEFASEILGHDGHAVATSSGTAALHIAYAMALGKTTSEAPFDREREGEVIAPVFTCTATNIPWIYLGQRIRWADIDPATMNISPESVERLIGPETRGISVVHYGGYPADMTALREIAEAAGIPIIEDAAQALGASVAGVPVGTISEFTMFSFQAIKHITTGDGGMLTMRDSALADLARRLRWFGIDRKAKQGGTWENDVTELGYKAQMTDMAASMGRAALSEWPATLAYRRGLLARYEANLAGIDGIRLLVPGAAEDVVHAAWLATVVVDDGCDRLRARLRNAAIEANPVHFRNDRYTMFKGVAEGACPAMDSIDGRYLCLPLHMGVSPADVDRASEVIASGW